MGKFRASCLLFSAYAVRRVVAMAQTWSDIERESDCTTSHCVARGIDSRSFGNRNCRGLFYPLCGKRKGICRRFAPYADSVRRSRIRPQCDGASAYVSGVYGAVDNLAPSQCLFYPALFPHREEPMRGYRQLPYLTEHPLPLPAQQNHILSLHL